MSEPYIPSFIISNNLDNPSDIISYILNYYCQVPSNIFDNYYDMEISIRKDIAIAGGNLERLKDLVIESLFTTITKYYPNYSTLDIDVTFEPVDPTKPNDDDVNIVIFINAIINNKIVNLNLVKELNKISN